MSQKYFARRPFGYAGRDLDRGQVVPLAGAQNDEKLVRLGYFQALEEGQGVVQCGHCHAQFIDHRTLQAHGNDRHRARVLTPHEEDAKDEQREQMLEEIAPLYLDQTVASKQAGAGVPEIATRPATASRRRQATRANVTA